MAPPTSQRRSDTEPPNDLALERTMTMTEAVSDTAGPVRIEGAAATEARYVVRGEFARGGLGRVLTAYDERLDRKVAIKELLAKAGTPAQVGRFQREAAITARLQHPAIVPVYDAGVRQDGQPFYVMKLLENGRTLKEAAAEAGTLDKRLALLPNVIAVADAIAYAHSVGIVHRDIKPSNVILGPFGETVVIDWGLAKDLTTSETTREEGAASPYRSGAAQLTSDGSILGTPHYMAPEQARGERVDRRADVYSLGALLYFVLGGVAPFDGSDSAEVIRRVITGPPTALGHLQTGLPPDLVAIVHKAMDRDRARRYPSAAELADDLKRFQTGQLVRAHDYSTSALMARFMRRHKVPSALALLFLVILAGTVTASIRRIRAERSVAVAERNRLILAQATSALDSDPTLAIEWLKTYPADGDDWERAQAIAADAQSRGIARHLLPTMAQTIAAFPDGKRVATGGPERTVQVWDTSTGAPEASATFNGDVTGIKLSPDGTMLVVGDRSGEVTLWDPFHGTRVPIGKHEGGALRVAYAPDGRRVASASLERVIVWDVVARRQLASTPSTEPITQIAFTPDGYGVVYATVKGTLGLWDPTSGEVRKLRGHTDGIDGIALSRDGRTIITGGRDHTVRVWDRQSGQSRILGTHDDVVRIVVLSPDGTLAASAGLDKKVRLWKVDGSGGRLLGAHGDSVNDLMFSPDGRTLASCSTDRQVRLWDLATGDDRVLRGHKGDVGWTLYSPDGATLTTAGYDQFARVWKVEPDVGTILGRHHREALHVLFSPSGAQVASDSSDRTARLWDLTSGKEIDLDHSRYSAMSASTGLAFSADGRVLAGGGDNTVNWWNLATGESHAFTDRGLVRKVALSPDGNLVAAAGSDGVVRLWDVAAGRARRLEGHKGEVTTVTFAASGKLIASAGLDGTVRLWDPVSGQGRVLGSHDSAPRQLVFAPDGSRLASADWDGVIKLWDLRTTASRTLHGHTDAVAGLAFSRDGALLVSGSWDRTARVWDVVSGTSRVLRWHDEPIRSVAIAPDGKRVVTGSNDGTVRMWDLDSGAFAILRGHRASVRSLSFSPDGRRLVSASEDTTVRLWDLSRVHMVPRDRTSLVTWMNDQTSATLAASSSMATRAGKRRGK